MNDAELPDSLSLDEAFRAAFYIAVSYRERDDVPRRDSDVDLLIQYLWTDPARWGDWKIAVRRALADGGLANADHEGRWQPRPDLP